MAEAYFRQTIDPEPGLEAMLASTLISQARELNELEKCKAVVVRLAIGGSWLSC